jgi:hypothetical protein
MKAALARLASLQGLLIAATVAVGLCQLGYAYFARNTAASCVTQRFVVRDPTTRASFGFGLARGGDAACRSVSGVQTRRH